MIKRLIHSVGIDIGTTTTQVIFSELELVNRAPASQVPQYEFSRRDIAYVSPVIFTPIDSEGRVNQEELGAFIRGQYQTAGLDIQKVESGAIIITGETSKAKNARDTIMDLARVLGDFVVATAGPHLESIIAGQGSGAAEYSKANASRVLNIDIGGGTANYVVFENGRVIDTACLNVGGHLVETYEDGRIKVIREPARIMCRACFGSQFDPMSMNPDQLITLMDYMAKLVMEVTVGEPSAVAQELLMTDCLKTHQYQQIFISGGVGECYYSPETVSNPFMFKDTGPLLARALHGCSELTALTTKKPNQTVRATVIGAGAYTLSLSGSTIWLNAEHLPIRNVPVLQSGLSWDDLGSSEKLVEAWALSATRMDLDPTTDLYALALPDDMKVIYKNVLEVTEALKSFNSKYVNQKYPLLVMAKQDLGKVLGMELQPFLNGRELAVIDEVETREGDYVDIGKPLFSGDVVPLTVKSLAFPS
ncbi:ethanolamine ammonia-lyase reactivating factor EutA [Neisseria sp. Ec49-e6-T10]|uniref:ethanolamine ammonia-lyase reactivating factor EutA n=1 Tax=Neisseria sp. Ec49-e6-T10 TaxID=3140744 RepID=UPI003EBF9787